MASIWEEDETANVVGTGDGGDYSYSGREEAGKKRRADALELLR